MKYRFVCLFLCYRSEIKNNIPEVIVHSCFYSLLKIVWMIAKFRRLSSD